MASNRRQEMREWFRVRDEQGWSLRQLAEAAGIARGTASWWSHELRREREGQTGKAFSRVVITDGPDEAESRCEEAGPIRVLLPDGVALEFRGDVDPDTLATVIASVEARC